MARRASRPSASLMFFGCWIALTGLATLSSFVLAAHWRQAPFAGFFTEPNLVVSSLGEQVSGAVGLRNPDRLLAVNGAPVRTYDDVEAILRTVERGQAARYTVQRADGQVVEIVLPVTQLSLESFFLLFFVPFVLGVFYLAVGTVIFSLRPDTRPTQAFLVFCLATSLCLTLLFNVISSHELVRLWVAALPLAGAALLHLALVFPRAWWIVRRAPALAWLPYAPALLAAAAAEWTLDDPARYTGSWRLSFLLIGVFALGCLLALALGWLQARSPHARRPVGVVALGGALAFGPLMFWMLLAAAGVTLAVGPELPALCMTIFPVAVGYAVMRHGLFEINVLVRRSLLYFTLTVVLLALYFLLVTALQRLFQMVLGETTDLSVIGSTLILAALFFPLRNRIQDFIDRTFYRERYDYQRSLLQFAESTRTNIHLADLLRQLVSQVRETMHVTHGLVLLTNDGVHFTLAEAQGLDLPLDTTVVLPPDLTAELLRGRPLDTPAQEPFAPLHTQLLVPLVHQNSLEGILGLGPKLSGVPYGSEDRGLLTTLADQVSAAITIAKLVRENEDKQRMERELTIAREIQQTFFPHQLPTVPGLEIAALCRPARETGGDLYEFLPLSHNSLGVVIGDVSGKGLPAALIMAVSLGVIRAEIEAHEHPRTVLNAANRWLCRDMPSGHFVSLLYMICDSAGRRLTVGNAGHLWPILLRDGAAQYVKLPPAFPLGIFVHRQYQDQDYELYPGDRLILYTDGVVEAMNSQEELFGFDRLLETCQRLAHIHDPQAMLDAVMATVTQFTGDTEQTDDLTLIVVAALASEPSR